MAHLQLYDKSLFALKELDIIEFVEFLSMASLETATILFYILGVNLQSPSMCCWCKAYSSNHIEWC